MPTEPNDNIVDSLTLRFVGEEEDGTTLHELRASHVAEVLQGLVGLTSDFDKAGAFNVDGPSGSEVLVRPAQEGSFVIEIVRVITDTANAVADAGGAIGIPSIAGLIYLATKSTRADVKDAVRIDGTELVKITWQDDTIDEVSVAVWDELKVRKRRRKKHLRQIMAPLSDARVTSLDVALPASADPHEAPEMLVLSRPDYDAVRPEDDVEESQTIFNVEAQMSAIDFDDSTKWKVKTKDVTRGAAVEDNDFLAKVAGGFAIRKDDIFNLRIREDRKTTNGNTRSTWTVLKVTSHRRAAGDNDT